MPQTERSADATLDGASVVDQAERMETPRVVHCHSCVPRLLSPIDSPRFDSASCRFTFHNPYADAVRPYEAVVFDLDGTLFDHQSAAQAAVSAFARSLGATPTQQVVSDWFAAEALQFERWRSGEISFEEQRRARLRDVLPKWGLKTPASNQAIDALFAKYLAEYERAWQLFPGAAELLAELRNRGYGIGLLTNGSHSQQMAKLQQTGLSDAFDAVCISENLGVQKPDPAAFRAVASALDEPVARCLFVGDDPRVDIAGARAAGMGALQVSGDDNRVGGIADAVLGALGN